MLIIHEKMAPGTHEKRHFHSISRQFFYVLEENLTIELEGVKHEIKARHPLKLPRIISHHHGTVGNGAPDNRKAVRTGGAQAHFRTVDG